mmetsp:Transcript_11065/g.39090  ORF Transcript_11065/g.39090 Transcript_11065/m.39090 type:complete len:311 (-) Transcript_11065:95-1027(-)
MTRGCSKRSDCSRAKSKAQSPSPSAPTATASSCSTASDTCASRSAAGRAISSKRKRSTWAPADPSASLYSSTTLGPTRSSSSATRSRGSCASGPLGRYWPGWRCSRTWTRTVCPSSTQTTLPCVAARCTSHLRQTSAYCSATRPTTRWARTSSTLSVASRMAASSSTTWKHARQRRSSAASLTPTASRYLRTARLWPLQRQTLRAPPLSLRPQARRDGYARRGVTGDARRHLAKRRRRFLGRVGRPALAASQAARAVPADTHAAEPRRSTSLPALRETLGRRDPARFNRQRRRRPLRRHGDARGLRLLRH